MCTYDSFLSVLFSLLVFEEIFRPVRDCACDCGHGASAPRVRRFRKLFQWWNLPLGCGGAATRGPGGISVVVR